MIDTERLALECRKLICTVKVALDRGKFVYIERSELNRCMFMLQQKNEAKLGALLQEASVPPRSKKSGVYYNSALNLIKLDRSLYEELQKVILKWYGS